ncbi:MAG: hypothetical protein RMA76_13620 [Deltaproteobacteria bacterium]|jgi:hypothetical protein
MLGTLIATLVIAAPSARVVSGPIDFTPTGSVLPANGVLFVLYAHAGGSPDVTYTSSVFGSGTLTESARYGGLVLFDLPEGPGPLSITIEDDSVRLQTNVELTDTRDDDAPAAPAAVATAWSPASDDALAIVNYEGTTPVDVFTENSQYSNRRNDIGGSCETARVIDHAGNVSDSAPQVCADAETGGCTTSGAASWWVLAGLLVVYRRR